MKLSALRSPEPKSPEFGHTKRAALYVRVSTVAKSRKGDSATFIQNPDVQEQPLRELIAHRGWDLYQV